MSIYLSSFTVVIPVNYTSEFLERFQAARYFQDHYDSNTWQHVHPAAMWTTILVAQSRSRLSGHFFFECNNEIQAAVLRTILDICINDFIVKSSPLN